MAKHDIKVVDNGGLNTLPTIRFQTEANSTAIYSGEPVKLKSAGSPYIIAAVDADWTPGTDIMPFAIAASDSTHTASVDGAVDIYIPYQWAQYEAKAKTGTNVNTQAKIDAMCGDRKILDLTSTTWTVDDGAADNVANSVFIIGGDPVKQTLKFLIKPFTNAVDGG